MATIRLAMSAAFPGSSDPASWDTNWTGQVTGYAWTSTAANGGTTSNKANAGSISLSGTQDGTDNFSALGVDGGALFQFSSVPVMTVVTQSVAGVSEQIITLNAPWNTIKDIEVTSLDTNVLNVNNFVDTWVSDAADNLSHTIDISGAKRADVSLGNGNDNVNINFMSNEANWSNELYVEVGDGNDTINIQPESFAAIAAANTPSGWAFNQTPEAATAIVYAGNGNDNISVDTSGVVQVGAGNDLISLVDGAHVVTLGEGSDTVSISAHNLAVPATAAFSTQRDINNIYLSAGHATIAINDVTGDQTTPLTNLFVLRGETGGATPDVITYGHTDPTSNSFVGGDWSALSIDLLGYSANSTASLAPGSTNGQTLLKIHDAASGSINTLILQGAAPPNVAALHINFL